MKAPTKEDIKRARNAAGLTQAEAADVVHVSVDTWRKWEQGSPMNLAAWELFTMKVKPQPKWLSYTDFVDEDDNIGHTKLAICYPTLQEATKNSEVQSGDCTVVRAKNGDSVWYAVVYKIPTSWFTEIEELIANNYDPEKLPEFYFWEGQIEER